jgi:uncharacterized membrane protein YphA (DoxX/SURF4 family)
MGRKFLRLSQGLVSVLFVVSGLIKLNDPLGFSYKLTEYFHVFGWSISDGLSLSLGIFVCVLEVVCGVMLFLGFRLKRVTWLLLITMIFFTLLTGITYLSGYVNPAFYQADLRAAAEAAGQSPSFFQPFNEANQLVSDCGCFGDALKLSPKVSFWKDVVLLLLILFLLVHHREISPLTTPKRSRWMTGLAAVFSVFLSFYTLNYLPIIDFRPFQPGNHLPDLMKIPEGAPTDSFEMIFVYKNKQSGSIQEFSMDKIPGSGWEFIDRKDRKVREGYRPPVHDFVATDSAGNDRTDEILKGANVLLIISSDLSKLNASDFQPFGTYASLLSKGFKVFVWTSGLPSDVERIQSQTHLPYEWLTGDRTLLKTIVRSNPGLTYLRKGTVVKHWSSAHLPKNEDLIP